MSLESIGTLLSAPQADQVIEQLGAEPNDIDVLTFWSVEPPYPSDMLRYHLGQVGALALMNQLADKGCKVQAFICDPDSRSLVGGGVAKPGRDIEITKRFISSLADTSINVRLMSEFIESLQADNKNFSLLADCAVRGAQKFRDCIQEHRPPKSVLDRLPQFRVWNTNTKLDANVANFVRKLQDVFPDSSAEELLASLYASQRRPKWFDAFWMGDMAAWLSLYVSKLQARSGAGVRRVVLLEANRSAYSWLTHLCFLKIGLQVQSMEVKSITWPQMCFVDPLLATDGRSAMQLDQRHQAIFLAHSREGIGRRLRASADSALESYGRWLLSPDDLPSSRSALVDALLERICKYRDVLESKDAALLTQTAKQRPPVAAPRSDIRIGLCLSGGGFRATFFHLGLIKLLRDAQLLNRVNTVYSVSGGSILAANLALNWDVYSSSQDDKSFFEAASALFRLARTDVRGRIVRRLWLFLPFFGGWRTAYLERLYKGVARFDGAELGQLPESPFFTFLATSMRSGKLVSFTRDGFDDGTTLHASSHLSVARAVAASSAFPPLFPPIGLSAKDAVSGDEKFPRTERLTDGGVFDNLGLTKLLAEAKSRLDEDWCNLAIVSDASAPFEWSASETFGFVVKRTIRTTDILMKRVAELEAERAAERAHERAQADEPFVTVVNIEDTASDADIGAVKGDTKRYHVQDSMVQKLVKSIRTDLDTFSAEEVCSLMRHGYEVGLRRLKEDSLLPADFQPRDPCGVSFPHCRDLASPVPTRPNLELVARPAKAQANGIEHLRNHLKKSARRRYRLWSARDHASWIVATLLFVAFVWWVSPIPLIENAHAVFKAIDFKITQSQ